MVKKLTLDEFKAIVEFHIKNELDIMEMMFILSEKDVEDFTVWYNNHSYVRGIDDIRRLVRGRANKTN